MHMLEKEPLEQDDAIATFFGNLFQLTKILMFLQNRDLFWKINQLFLFQKVHKKMPSLAMH